MIKQPQPIYEDKLPKEPIKTYDEVREGNRIIYKERTEDLNKGLCYSDFSIQSLLDADAVDLLQPVQPIQRDNLSVADIANSVADNISLNIESVKTDDNNQPKTDE